MDRYETLGEKVLRVIFTTFLIWVAILGVNAKLAWMVFMYDWNLV